MTFVKNEMYQNLQSKKTYWCVSEKPPILRATRRVGTRVVKNPDPKKYRKVERIPV